MCVSRHATFLGYGPNYTNYISSIFFFIHSPSCQFGLVARTHTLVSLNFFVGVAKQDNFTRRNRARNNNGYTTLPMPRSTIKFAPSVTPTYLRMPKKIILNDKLLLNFSLLYNLIEMHFLAKYCTCTSTTMYVSYRCTYSRFNVHERTECMARKFRNMRYMS